MAIYTDNEGYFYKDFPEQDGLVLVHILDARHHIVVSESAIDWLHWQSLKQTLELVNNEN